MQRYNLTAEMYDERYKEEQNAKYKKALETVDVAGMVVLDAGCGSGLFFSHVAAKADIVVGIDISRKLLKKAQNQENTLKNVFVVKADADHLPFRDGFFGGVFALRCCRICLNLRKRWGSLNGLSKAMGNLW